MMNNKASLDTIRLAENAWLDGDLEKSSQLIETLFPKQTRLISQQNLKTIDSENGINTTPLYFNGHDVKSSLVKFDKSVSIFDIGLPLSIQGVFFSKEFSHLKYPERYMHLYSSESINAIKSVINSSHYIENTYLTLIRKPYYHWMLDTLPHLLGLSLLKTNKTIQLISNDLPILKGWQREILKLAVDMFKIENLSWLNLNGNIVKSQPCFSQTRMPLSDRLMILRTLKPKDNKKRPWRYIYTKRSNKDIRKLSNENELISKLDKRFEIIEPGKLDIRSQINLFSEAKCVVGICGSNLTNISFCEINSSVIEISAGYDQKHFENIANTIGLNFSRVKGNPLKPESNLNNKWKEAHSDFKVNVKEVIDTISKSL